MRDLKLAMLEKERVKKDNYYVNNFVEPRIDVSWRKATLCYWRAASSKLQPQQVLQVQFEKSSYHAKSEGPCCIVSSLKAVCNRLLKGTNISTALLEFPRNCAKDFDYN